MELNLTDVPENLTTCPGNLAIPMCRCTGPIRINATEVGEFVRTCNNGLYQFGSRCDRCVCAVIYSGSRTLDVVETTIRKAVENNTPIPILIRQIQAIGPAANLFFTGLNDLLKQSLAPLQDHWFGVGVGLGVVGTILIGYWYLRRDTMILGRRNSANDTGHEYLIQSRFSFQGNAWYAASSLSAALRELAFEFDSIIQTPKEIVAKRAVDRNGNECEVENAFGLQYLVRSEGWRIGHIEDVWVGQQQLETDQWIWPMVCRFEAEVGNARTIVQAVPFESQQSVDGGRARDALGRFL